jgi:hypothetical protein
MTVDEALEHTRRIWDKGGSLEDMVALKALAGEVERLRAETKERVDIAHAYGFREHAVLVAPGLTELARFREREPLVVKVLNWNIVGPEQSEAALAAVRDFKVLDNG